MIMHALALSERNSCLIRMRVGLQKPVTGIC